MATTSSPERKGPGGVDRPKHPGGNVHQNAERLAAKARLSAIKARLGSISYTKRQTLEGVIGRLLLEDMLWLLERADHE